MELFGLVFAVPVTLVASLVYTALLLALFRFLPTVGRLLAAASLIVVAAIAVEAVFLGAMGPKGSYAHLGHGFTALHFFGFFLGQPAIANLVYFYGARRNLKWWLRFSSATVCCWITCMAALLGHIAVDEAIVGIDAGRPFYMKPPGGPNPAASGNGAISSLFHAGRQVRAVPEPQC
jgi:hypothetical protein